MISISQILVYSHIHWYFNSLLLSFRHHLQKPMSVKMNNSHHSQNKYFCNTMLLTFCRHCQGLSECFLQIQNIHCFLLTLLYMKLRILNNVMSMQCTFWNHLLFSIHPIYIIPNIFVWLFLPIFHRWMSWFWYFCSYSLISVAFVLLLNVQHSNMFFLSLHFSFGFWLH